MTGTAKMLVPLKFPLAGEKLIEASAGTGKTYTIMILYLRLLLHHGVKADTDNSNTQSKLPKQLTAFHSPLNVKQILVVTFTEAATAELRGRIRTKIAQAKLAFSTGSSEDKEITQLLNETDPAVYQRYVLQLEANERLMDEASIFTIHGFCQRMLKQNAFESGAFFNIELVESREHSQVLAVRDYWRKHINSLPTGLFNTVLKLWKSPEVLLNSLQICLDKKDIEIRSSYLPAGLELLNAQYKTKLEQFKTDWLSAINSCDIVSLLQQIRFKKSSKYSKQDVSGLVNAVTDWAENNTDNTIPDELQYFTLSKLLSSKLASADEPRHVIFTQCEAFLTDDLVSHYEKTIKDTIYIEALNYIRKSVFADKINRQELSFNDLLHDMDDALEHEQGEQLAQRIREQYPVAMIDEFQDTDSVQYRIFSRIYKDQPATGWYMIGDPKQAIYAFRGADIFTYINARRTISEHYSLITNWRSSSAMIQAVNQIFEFSTPDNDFAPFIYNKDIPFHKVSPPLKENGQICRADVNPLMIDGKTPEALVLLLNTTEQGYISKSDYERNMSLITAQRICSLINQGEAGTARIGQRPVASSDIAVLVRDGEQAKLIKNALLLRGINSVYLSERSNVFATREAMGITYILRACLEPDKKSRLKTAVAVPFLELSMQELDDYEMDDNRLDMLSLKFQAYLKQWQAQGVLAMLRSLIFDFSLMDRYLAVESSTLNGERRLTDLLHLTELLQDASTTLDSEQALLQWLEDQIESNLKNTQERQLRLENDQKLVQIITVHKSKGLEYNIVFIPFVCRYRENRDAVLRYHEQNKMDKQASNVEPIRQIIDLKGTEEGKRLQNKESLAEELRLLYVGLTRSVHQCYLGMGPFRSGNTKKCLVHKSAMGYLLNSGQPLTQDEMVDQLKRHAQHPAIDIDWFSQQNELSRQQLTFCKIQQRKQIQFLEARKFEQQLQQNWWISSFTSLSRFHEHPDASEEQVDDAIDTPVPNYLPTDSIHTFPKGAQHGTFLHALFEAMDFTDRTIIDTQVIQLSEKYGYEVKWNSILTTMVNDCLNCSIQVHNDNSLQLKRIENNQKLVEMEFYLPMKNIDAESINTIICKYDPLSEQAGKLKFTQVQGMLKGFIDLFFEYRGKYYILDYKSNYLGESSAHYHQQALQAAMIEHRYDLQYQFYTLAIHRYLKSRIANYSYQQQFGGVIYLFLRGVNNDESNQYGIYYTCPAYELIRQLDCLFKQGVAETPVTIEQ